jgi:hypothetical protein
MGEMVAKNKETLDDQIFIRINSQKKQEFIATIKKIARAVPGAQIDYAPVIRGLMEEFVEKNKAR